MKSEKIRNARHCEFGELCQMKQSVIKNRFTALSFAALRSLRKKPSQ